MIRLPVLLMTGALLLAGGAAPAEEASELGADAATTRTEKGKADPSDPEIPSIINAVKGMSLHKPIFLFPLSYSEDYRKQATEVLFQFSVKLKLFEIVGQDAYFGYSQKSFWQMYNTGESAPFRDTNYAPELFYRIVPHGREFHRWAFDLGFEHESNGQRIGQSRSWNRIYLSPFQAKGRQLTRLKLWYRVPESPKKDPADARGDDNPDITDFLGYSEASFSYQIGGGQLLTAWMRGNPDTGRGAGSITWSIPARDRSLFYGVTLFSGYGESLMDYNREITRLSVGFMLSR